MGSDLSPQDRQRIAESVRTRYAAVAAGPEGRFAFPTGRAGLLGLGYGEKAVDALPDEVAAGYCGVGNPLALGPIRPGERVLDVGCGAGVDAILAARLVGGTGRVVGLEFSPDMLAKARANAAKAQAGNLSFVPGSAESLPFPDASFDVVISNGAYNLVVDKGAALAEAFRVLAPGGRLFVADQVLVGPPPQSREEAVSCWFR